MPRCARYSEWSFLALGRNIAVDLKLRKYEKKSEIYKRKKKKKKNELPYIEPSNCSHFVLVHLVPNSVYCTLINGREHIVLIVFIWYVLYGRELWNGL